MSSFHLNGSGQIVLEVDDSSSSDQYVNPDGTAGSYTGVYASTFVTDDVSNSVLNKVVYSQHLTSGQYAYTIVTYDNTILPSPDTLSFVLKYDSLNTFRHSNTFDYQQADGFGNFVHETFFNGSMTSFSSDHANGTFTAEHFTSTGVLNNYSFGTGTAENPGSWVSYGGFSNPEGGIDHWTKIVSNGSTIISSTVMSNADGKAAVLADAMLKTVPGAQLISEGSDGHLITNDGGTLVGNPSVPMMVRHRSP